MHTAQFMREKAIRSITEFVMSLYFDTTQLQYLLLTGAVHSPFNLHRKGYFSDILKQAFLRQKDSPPYQWAGTSDQEKQIPEMRHKSKIKKPFDLQHMVNTGCPTQLPGTTHNLFRG